MNTKYLFTNTKRQVHKHPPKAKPQHNTWTHNQTAKQEPERKNATNKQNKNQSACINQGRVTHKITKHHQQYKHKTIPERHCQWDLNLKTRGKERKKKVCGKSWSIKKTVNALNEHTILLLRSERLPPSSLRPLSLPQKNKYVWVSPGESLIRAQREDSK